MANAAAKKAAAARQAATLVYRPALILVNILYIYLRALRQWETWGLRPFLASLVIWGITYFSYHGIILDHENMVSMTASKGSSNPQTNGKKTRLAGGVYLDILALVLCVQFASLWKERILWLLIIFPIWGGYSLYHFFFKGMLPSTSNSVVPEEDPITEDKKRKGTERRRRRQE